jgi:hypothetical protein
LHQATIFFSMSTIHQVFAHASLACSPLPPSLTELEEYLVAMSPLLHQQCAVRQLSPLAFRETRQHGESEAASAIKICTRDIFWVSRKYTLAVPRSKYVLSMHTSLQ